jgi:hypothetical protein
MKKCFLSFLFLCSLPSIFSMDVSVDEQKKTEDAKVFIKTWIMVLRKQGREGAIKALKNESTLSLSEIDREFVQGVGLVDEEGCLSPLVHDVVQTFE